MCVSETSRDAKILGSGLDLPIVGAEDQEYNQNKSYEYRHKLTVQTELQ